MRYRPPQLRGLKPVTREPWKVDEDFYSARMRKVEGAEVPERYKDLEARAKEDEWRKTNYRARFDAKFVQIDGTLDAFDGNPFT